MSQPHTLFAGVFFNVPAHVSAPYVICRCFLQCACPCLSPIRYLQVFSSMCLLMSQPHTLFAGVFFNVPAHVSAPYVICRCFLQCVCPCLSPMRYLQVFSSMCLPMSQPHTLFAGVFFNVPAHVSAPYVICRCFLQCACPCLSPIRYLQVFTSMCLPMSQPHTLFAGVFFNVPAHVSAPYIMSSLATAMILYTSLDFHVYSSITQNPRNYIQIYKRVILFISHHVY